MLPSLAASGSEALKYLHENKDFDMVFTDMYMPEMNGVELARKVKELYPKLPIVLLTSLGYVRTSDHNNLFCDTLTKPVKYQMLCKAISGELRNVVHAIEGNNLNKKLSTDFSLKHPMKILVAEDNPVNQLLAVMVLKNWDITPIRQMMVSQQLKL